MWITSGSVGRRLEQSTRPIRAGLRDKVVATIYPLDYAEHTMSKSQDAKKTTKKEPAKTLKEKKEAKKVKKDEKARQQ